MSAFCLIDSVKTAPPLQYLRELTQNAIEAVQRTDSAGPDHLGRRLDFLRLGGGPMKVCIVDTGDGMTGDEMIRFINQLSSSGSEQSFTGNYGVGAKIAAATKNPLASSISRGRTAKGTWSSWRSILRPAITVCANGNWTTGHIRIAFRSMTR